MSRVFFNKTKIVSLVVFICSICIFCKIKPKEKIIYRNIHYEYDENLMQYGIDSSAMFKGDDKLSKIDYDSLQTVINQVYNATKDLIEDKTLTSDINDLYLKIKKDSVWLVDASFRTGPNEVMIGGSVSYEVSNDGKILSIIIWE